MNNFGFDNDFLDDDFEAEIERRLSEERQRRSQAQSRQMSQGQFQPSQSSQSQAQSRQMSQGQFQPRRSSQIQAQSRQMTQEQQYFTDDFDSDDEPSRRIPQTSLQTIDDNAVDEYEKDYEPMTSAEIPLWIRLIMTLILVGLGFIGIFLATSDESLVGVSEVICMSEAMLCFITAVCLNAEFVSERRKKEKTVRIALWILFALYCIKAMDTMFLGNLLANGIATSSEMSAFASLNVVTDFSEGFKNTDPGTFFAVLLYLVPIELCLPILISYCRNFLVYLCSVAWIYSLIVLLRIATLSGGFELMHIVIAAIGAVTAYLIFSFDSVQSLLRNVGLLDWIKADQDDDED